MIIQTTLISVYVTRVRRVTAFTNWHLFANYPNQHEAHAAVTRALAPDFGYTFAELRESTIYQKEA